MDKSSNFERNNGFVINWLSEQYNLSINTDLITELTNTLSTLDSLPTAQVYIAADSFTQDTLFIFQGKIATATDFYDYLVDKYSDKELNQVQPNWFSDYQEYFRF